MTSPMVVLVVVRIQEQDGIRMATVVQVQLLPELDSLIPSKFNRYFEPFLGGGAMFFHLVSDKNKTFTAYLSDTHQIKTYKVVMEHVEELIALTTAAVLLRAATMTIIADIVVSIIARPVVEL